jgi:galactofuranose transport system ATP-binding protein
VTAALLAVRGLSKRYGAVQALAGVDLDLLGGEVHALMGENGAGKSTLIRCITGVDTPDAGALALDGEPIAPRSPRAAEDLGIRCVHQEVHLIPHASVAENICIGREPMRRLPLVGVPWRIDWRAARDRARVALARVGLSIDPRRELASCPIAVQQLVAIARALDGRARVLVLDEPTSSLNDREVRDLFAVLDRLRGEGLGILIVTHFLDQVYRIADRITVLRDGTLAGSAAARELPRSALIAMMIGRAVEERGPSAAPVSTPSRVRSDAAPLLRARGLRRSGSLDGVSCEVGAGESLGLAGLLGSGRTETLRAIVGAEPATGGTIELEGVTVTPRSPGEAMRLGIAFLPENRKLDGIIPTLSVRENILLALQSRRGAWRPLARGESEALVERFITALRIRTPDANAPIGSLSGGNQQKALIARALATEPRLLLLDEPTRGIDIGAKDDVMRLINDLRSRDVALIVVSSELEELVRACGRVTVLRDRRSVAELDGDAVTPEAMLAAIARTKPASAAATGGER